MERQHGVILFTRNTRNVALTEAGAALYSSLAGATRQIDDAFAALTLFRDKQAGNLRLTVPRALGALVMKALIPRFRASHPEVTIDLSLDDAPADLIAQGYDAGIRLGQSVEQDMVALRLSGELRWSVVASPDYLARKGTPATPEDLLRTDRINRPALPTAPCPAPPSTPAIPASARRESRLRTAARTPAVRSGTASTPTT